MNTTSLTLFFTRRVGLRHWDQVGNLEREVEIYRRLAAMMRQVTFVTYGGRRDRALAAQIDPIGLCDTPSRLPVAVSVAFLAAFRSRVLQQSTLFKTNQIAGAELALWAKRRYGKPLIVRCGYLLGRFQERDSGLTWRARRAIRLERQAFLQADAGVVTSERDRRWVLDRHGADPNKIHVIPNYVVTDVFRPLPDVHKRYDLVCVAKQSAQKNIDALFGALRLVRNSGHPTSLLLIGTAASDDNLHTFAARHQLPVTFRVRVPTSELPKFLNQARAYVIPSLYEGHPKSLLEAMSCGLPCIGTDVEGVREDIEHMRTGFLCETSPDSLARAVQAVLADQQLQRALGARARAHTLDRYSIESVLAMELRLIQEVLP